MKRINFRFSLISALFTALAMGVAQGQTTTASYTNPTNNGTASNQFTVPTGVTTITVECWGGGGGGGGYSKKVYTGLVAGTIYNVNVGAGGTGGPNNSTTNAVDGGVSYFNTSTASDVMARGGSRGINAGIGGAGGAAGYGDVTYTGAAGTNSATNGGGGGGSSAGTASNGVMGVGATAGGVAPTGGGNGGAGSTSNNGTAGSSPGGGGGGSDNAASRSGGAGANGQVTVTYTLPNTTGLSAALTSTACKGGVVSFTISSSNLTTDTYTITYNITGTSNNVSSTTASVSFTAGSPGTGTFTTASVLSVAESDVLHITRVTSSSGNYVDLTNDTNFTVSSCGSWYSYQTGNFSDYNTWTLDPSGTTFDNGLSLTPTTGDEVTILNGFTVTYDVNTKTLSSTTIQGGAILDMAATTGHDLGVVTGTGLLRVGGISLPTGTYTDFVSTLGGTIEYYDVGGNLPTAQTTYNNLKMTNSTSSNITYVLVSNLTVNSTFSLSTTGAGTVTWQINDASNNQRTITLNGDLNVSSGGRITVGTGNETSTSPHALTIYGNITNNGIVKFYDNTDTELPESSYGNTTTGTNNIYTNELQGNAVTVTFSGTTSKTVTCNNTTDFYRFVLNKGTGQVAVLTVNASSSSYFRLFGPTNLGSTASGTVPHQYSNNALSVINGTLQLTGSINIPNLSVNGSASEDFFSIPQNGAIWLNGANVTVVVADNNTGNSDQRLMLNGMIRITDGTLDAGDSKGIGSYDGGSYFQEGGTVRCWQFRPKGNGTGIFSFNMTGGTLNVGYGYSLDGGVTLTDFARFDLNSINSTCQMSGGTLNVAKPVSGSGIFQVLSSSGNYNVTGGTINLYAGEETSGNSYAAYINSTAPLYNVTINEESATTQTTQLQNYDLTVQNNLTINTGNSPSFVTNGTRSVTIGGSFTINSGTTYTPGASTTTFNGTGAQTWTYDGTITDLTTATVVVNKSSGTLTLAGSQTFPNFGSTGATGGLTITSGTLADGGKTLTVDGVISNSGTHSGAGKIIVTTATTIGGSNGIFGNLRITTNNTVATSGGQTVTGNLELNGSSTCILNIAANNLTVNGTLTTTGTFGTSYYIRTNGLYSAGGLTRQGASGDLLFPVGSNGLYTPNTINVTATTHGKITVRPVNSEHPNVSTTSLSLAYYWRVTSTGYSGTTAATHKTYTFSTATKNGTLTTYRSARFDASALTWGTNNTTFDATGQTVIPNFSTGTSWSGVTGDQLDGEYTCGNAGAFGGVQPYYSQGSGAWNASTGVWTSSSTHVGTNLAGPPCATCPVVIGDGASINHTISIDANSRSCGSLTINSGSTLDCASYTGLNFGTSTGGSVSGSGTIRVSGSAFPTGDFANFIGSSGGTVEWYGTTKTIPSTYTGPGSTTQNLNTYYNLILNPTASNTITLPASNLTVYNNWTQQTGTGTVNNNGSRTLAITGNLAVSAGTFTLTNSGNTTMTVGGSVTNGGTFQTTGGTHTLSIVGGVTNTGTINFNNTGTVALTFTGSSNVSFTGAATSTTLYLVTVNKGSSQTPTLTFNVSGTVNTTSTTSGWLTVTNGTFDWATANTTTISSQAYTINPTAKLKASSGTVTICGGTSDAYDLFLNGTLEVSGGAVSVGNTSTSDGYNIDIEYGSAGVPALTISSGSLWVKGSVRRSSSTIAGALAYAQTGSSTVTIGGISSTDVNDRGVFEIDTNTGSSFTLIGTASLTIQRQTNGTGYADLYLNPITSNVSSTSTITVGLSTETGNTNFRINIAPSIGHFTVAGTNAHTVNMYSNPLVVGGNLTIPSPSTLVTNSLNVTIAGNLVCSGTYTGGTNNTTFNGTGAQSGQLSSTSTFNDFTVSKTSGTTLSLSGSSPTLQNLYILSGILDVGTLALDIRKNVTNSSSQTGSGSILIYSTSSLSNTITSSNGSFTNLTLGGTASSKTITVTGNTTINGTLAFPASGTRYFSIGSSQLTFSSTASAVSNAGSTRYIRTNGVSSDLGVAKTWPVGSSQTFVYQIGSSSYYTPVSYSLTVTTSGTLTVIPVNSVHPTYNQASSEEILNYYWTVQRGSTLAATASGSHTYTYPSSLLTCTSCTGTPLAGYLDGNSDPLGWTTSGHGGTATTTVMTFASTPTTNLPTAGNYYDYSVGTANTLPNPILPLYSRISPSNSGTVGSLTTGGGWTTASNWTTDSDGDLDGNNASSLVPTGVPVVIIAGARINTQSNGRKAYKTTINGILNNGTRTGHSLGIISGTGTFRTATNTFPAGNYTAFVAAGGGTIEYVAPLTMNSRTTYNNLSIYSGSSGTLTMTNSDLVLNGNLTIPTGTTLDNANNRDMTIAGNWSNSGTFTQGTGEVSFNGTGAQTISGTNTFYDLTLSKSSENVTLSGTGTTNVSNSLTLTTGNIISSSTNTLALGSATINGGSSGSYIAGPFTKTVGASSTFNIPAGSISPARYRPAVIANTSSSDSWTFEYVGANPTTGGYPNATKNTTNLGAVSQYEYWLISRAGSTSADVTLTYGSGSYSPPDIGVVANLRVAHWDGTQWDLPPGSGTHSQSGTNTDGTVTVTNVTSFSPLTFGSLDTNSPLPVTLVSFTGKLTIDGIQLKWKTLTEVNNNYFEIEKSATGEAFSAIAKVKGAGTSTQPKYYDYLDTDVWNGKTYYRLKQVDFSGQFEYSDVISVDYSEGSGVMLAIYPNPAQGNSVTLEISGVKDLSQLPVSIIDQIGHEVLSGKLDISNGAATVTVPVENLPNGMYLLKVGTTNQLIRRIIIAH